MWFEKGRYSRLLLLCSQHIQEDIFGGNKNVSRLDQLADSSQKVEISPYSGRKAFIQLVAREPTRSFALD